VDEKWIIFRMELVKCIEGIWDKVRPTMPTIYVLKKFSWCLMGIGWLPTRYHRKKVNNRGRHLKKLH
jgi:hypothetical protein